MQKNVLGGIITNVAMMPRFSHSDGQITMEAKILKGAAVRPAHANVDGAIVMSEEDIANWRASEDARGMTSAGETRLPPFARYVDLDPERTYVVLRARAKVRLGFGQTPTRVLVLDASTGDQIYVRRQDLVVVG